MVKEMAKVVVFDPAKLPVTPTTPSKHDRETLDAYVAAIGRGQGAGDGLDYATQKEARSAANSIKRGMKRAEIALSTKMRVWNSGSDTEPKWHFALLANTASNAPKATTPKA